MKDSQREVVPLSPVAKYIKANNERFSTSHARQVIAAISISRRIMKDSQRKSERSQNIVKYIKANNERFSTVFDGYVFGN